MEERTQVYAFEQDQESEGGVKHEDGAINQQQQNESDLPNIIQTLLKWQFPRNKLICNVGVLALCFQGYNLFSIIFNSPYISMGIMGPILPLGFALWNLVPDYGKGIFQNILHENPKMLKGIVKKMSMITIPLLPIMLLLFVAIVVLAQNFNIVPYGKHTDLVYYISLGLSAGIVFVWPTGMLLLSMYQYTAKLWTEKIKIYMDTIHDKLLQFDLETGNKSKCLNDIYKSQEVAEEWALKVNKKMTILNGLFVSVWIMMSIVMIVIIWIMQSVNPSPTNTWKIGFLAFFALFFLLFGILILYFLAKPNQVWIKHSNYILNDARIMIRKEELFGSQFDQWLSQQEINSQRLFNIKLTSKLLGRLAALLSSVFTIVFYFIIREELRSFASS